VARRSFGRGFPSDAVLREQLIGSVVAAIRLDGRTTDFAATALAVLDLIDLEAPPSRLQSALDWLVTQANRPGAFGEGCTAARHAHRVCEHFVGGFFSPAPPSQRAAPASMPNGKVYRVESQARFAEAFRGDAVFAIPEVVASTQHVIISEWLEGVPLSRLIANGTKAERDLGARRYMEFLLAGPARAGLLHADPHPGNYRLLADGRFGVLDFGAIKRLPDGMPPEIGRLLTQALCEDAAGVVAGLRDEGFIKASIDIDGPGLLDYLRPFLEPARHTTWAFSRAWMRELFSHINDPRRPQWSLGLKLNLPPEYLLIHRVWLGGVGVLCQIDGEVPVLQVLAEWLPEFDVEALDYVEFVDEDDDGEGPDDDLDRDGR